jgi:hypothetical protein
MSQAADSNTGGEVQIFFSLVIPDFAAFSPH